MNPQNATTNKLVKSTIFVFKSIKAVNAFSTDPTTATIQTILTTVDPTVI